MSITDTGPIFVLLGFYVFLRHPRALPFLVVFFSPFSSTAVVNFVGLGYKSGGLGLTPANMFLILFFVSQLLYGLAFRPLRVSAGLLVQIALLAGFALLLLASLLWNGVTEGLTSYEMTQSVYVLLGVTTTALFAFEFSRPGGIETFARVTRAAAVFCSFWGVLQIVCYAIHLPYPSVVFNNSLSDAADMFHQEGDGFMRMASVAVEPSFFAQSMLHFVSFGITILVAEPRLRTGPWLRSVAFVTIVLLMSTSSTGYVGMAVLAMLLLVRWPIAAALIGTPAVLIGAFAVMLIPKAAEILATMTINKSSTGSFQERTAGAIEALRVFGAHPFFGGGWGSAPNFNSVTATLGNVGVIGTIVFLLAAAATIGELQSRRTIDKLGPNWQLAAYGAGVQNALIVAFVCSITSGIKYVVLDDWIYWAFGIAIASAIQVAAGRSTGQRAGSRPHSIDVALARMGMPQ